METIKHIVANPNYDTVYLDGETIPVNGRRIAAAAERYGLKVESRKYTGSFALRGEEGAIRKIIAEVGVSKRLSLTVQADEAVSPLFGRG